MKVFSHCYKTIHTVMLGYISSQLLLFWLYDTALNLPLWVKWGTVKVTRHFTYLGRFFEVLYSGLTELRLRTGQSVSLWVSCWGPTSSPLVSPGPGHHPHLQRHTQMVNVLYVALCLYDCKTYNSILEETYSCRGTRNPKTEQAAFVSLNITHHVKEFHQFLFH